MTKYLRPRSLGEALDARAQHPQWLLLAGGTDLMVGARHRPAPAGLIDLFGLAPLIGVRDEGTATVIGAGTTFAQILASELVHKRLPALHAASREVGAAQIQSRATIGGNVGTSSPVGDSLPVLLALDAEVVVESSRARRVIRYDQFCTGYRSTALADDELILELRFPAIQARQFWRKVGTRSAQSISKVTVAAAARVDDAGRVQHVRIALGAVRERPVRAYHAERALQGAVPDPAAVATALEADIAPIDDVRSTAAYRRAIATNLVTRFVTSL